ncbi:MAG: diguanylate cyclase [Desulfovermiculus sp.]|nr:diguanylate cyclase [Desulfovermiculus sp.]
MSDKKNDFRQTPAHAGELRKRAEEKAEAMEPISLSGQLPEEMQQILHELRVHQIELELQNEELRTAQEKIEKSRARYFDLYDLAPVGYATVSEKGLILEANLTAATLLGVPRGALVKQPISRFILKEDQDIYYLHRKKLFETGDPQECELRLVKPDGSVFWVHLTETATQAKDGATVCRVVLSDITERKQAEEALQEREQRYRQLFESSPISVWEQDFSEVKNRIDELKSQGIEDLYSYFLEHPDLIWDLADLVKTLDINQQTLNLYRAGSKEELLSGMTKIFGRESHKSFAANALMVIARGEKGFVTERDHVTLDGKQLKTQLYWRVAKGHEETYARVLVSIVDITERKNFEEQLKYLSLHDQMTGLYNRAYLENELQRLQNSRDFPITIINVDVDGLKLVNDTLGHDHGDDLLKLCAKMLQESFRGSDIVARAGGDEFVILLPRTELQTGEKIVQRIQFKTKNYNQVHKGQMPLSLSIGLACADNEQHDLIEVLKQADDLMYRDKLNRNINSRSQIMRALMVALEERDFITSGHVQRLEEFCVNLGKEMELSVNQISNLKLLAQVHDLGKVGIPDHILFKPGPLIEAEWEIMRQHSEKGHRIALALTDLAGIADLILKHHERWDGQGYPLGLAGEEIPFECRILAITDAFDAMANDRPYRNTMSIKEAVQELRRCAGTQFDPDLVEVFIRVLERVDSE